MSRIRLLALLAACLVVLAFAGSAMAAGGGSSGDDNLKGSARADTMQLRGGDDVLTDDRGTDRFAGGAGDDRINARDRRGRHDARDIVDCGAGDDTVIADDDDLVRSNCEHVTRVADDNGVDPAGDDKGLAARGAGADDPVGHR